MDFTVSQNHKDVVHLSATIICYLLIYFPQERSEKGRACHLDFGHKITISSQDVRYSAYIIANTETVIFYILVFGQDASEPI